MRLHHLGLIGLPLLLLASPVSAATSKQKQETCAFGADEQKLAGAERSAFIKRCMGSGNYEPPARRASSKSGKKRAKKPTQKPAMAPAASAAPAPAAAPAAAPKKP